MRRALALGIALLAAYNVACATPSRYYWGDYEDRLLASYQDPEKEAAFTAHLLHIIDQSEAKKKTVPPGIFAEYGYALYRAGKNDEAIVYLEREATAWPESSGLMTLLVQRIRSAPARDDTGDAAATPPEDDPASSLAPDSTSEGS